MRRILNQATAMLAAVVAAALLAACGKAKVEQPEYGLDREIIGLNVGESAMLKVVGDGQYQVEWSSPDEIVSVEQNGRVTALGAGNATVYADITGEGFEPQQHICIVTITATRYADDLGDDMVLTEETPAEPETPAETPQAATEPTQTAQQPAQVPQKPQTAQQPAQAPQKPQTAQQPAEKPVQKPAKPVTKSVFGGAATYRPADAEIVFDKEYSLDLHDGEGTHLTIPAGAKIIRPKIDSNGYLKQGELVIDGRKQLLQGLRNKL